MGMWPFRRRSQRKKAAATALGGAGNSSPDRMHDAGIQQDPARQDGAELAHAGPERRKSRRDTKRKASRESKKLQRDPEKRDKRRTYSFSPGRNDSIRVARAPDDRPPVPAIPPSKLSEKGRALTGKRASNPAGAKPLRASTQPPEDTQQEWQRMPTLHKRSAQELARRKSSKKRKGDPDREAEIKAMVAYMPNRPAADVNSSGRPMKRETIRRGKIVHKLEKKSSDVSLPVADSLRSSLSDNSEPQTSFIVSGFDMLAPRPTIRYSENPRYVPGASGFGPARSDSKRKLSDRPPFAAELLRANKWIDNLADDFSAGELRELMERDEKRKEKKKIADRIKMERRLARRQEKQKVDEAEAAREGTPPPVNMERGVLGRDVVGLGIGTSAIVTSNKRKSSAGSEDERGPRPAESFRQDSAISGQNPFADFHRSPSLATENFTPGSERSDPVIETALMGTVAKASVSPTLPAKGHTRGQSSISQMMDLSHSEAPQPSTIPEPIMQAAATPVKTPSSWTSFFKLRGAKSKRATPPSSFSNTSRDSMHTGQAPQIGHTPMRSTSNIPKRTMSKFREDLPELPLSPPDSRVQSPEADVVPPIQTEPSDIRSGVQTSPDDPRVRYDTPTSGYRSLEALRHRQETPNSHRSLDAPSPEATVLSQSLASIDSEGSWLSGRRAGSKRGSSALAQHPPIRDSSDSLNKKYKEFSESAEELGIAEDEYFSRLTPGPEEEHKIQNRRSGNPMPSSDDEEGGSISSPVLSEKTKWGAVGRHPTVIHREPRAKSREGLLTEFDDDSDDELPSSPTSTDQKNEGLQRATSIDLNRKHARHISAGSARLLDLKPSTSVDSRRNSARLSSS